MLEALVSASGSSTMEGRVAMMARVRDYYVGHVPRQTEAELEKLGQEILDLIPTSNLLDRIALAKTIGRVGRAPRSLQARLLKDNFLVAAPILESGPVSDEDLLQFIIDGDEKAKLVIAGRSRLSVRLTDRLAIGASAALLLRLARNPGARFSEPTIEILLYRAGTDPDLGGALAERADLQPSVRGRIGRGPAKDRRRVDDLVARDLARARKARIIR